MTRSLENINNYNGNNSKNSFQTRLQKNKSKEESFRTSFRNNKKGVEWKLFPVKK